MNKDTKRLLRCMAISIEREIALVEQALIEHINDVYYGREDEVPSVMSRKPERRVKDGVPTNKFVYEPDELEEYPGNEMFLFDHLRDAAARIRQTANE